MSGGIPSPSGLLSWPRLAGPSCRRCTPAACTDPHSAGCRWPPARSRSSPWRGCLWAVGSTHSMRASACRWSRCSAILRSGPCCSGRSSTPRRSGPRSGLESPPGCSSIRPPSDSAPSIPTRSAGGHRGWPRPPPWSEPDSCCATTPSGSCSSPRAGSGNSAASNRTTPGTISSIRSIGCSRSPT